MEFQECARGNLLSGRMTVLFARGDRPPVVSRDMTIEQFGLCNPAGEFLVITAGFGIPDTMRE